MCEAMPTFFTFLLFLSYTSLTVGQRMTRLIRQKSLPEDDFLLPRDSADCPRKVNVYAPLCQSKFNAAPIGGCWCQCGSPTDKKTFYEPRNSCVKVSVARQDAGMSTGIPFSSCFSPLLFSSSFDFFVIFNNNKK